MAWVPIVAAIAGGAASGAAGGKKGGGGDNPAADTQARLASQLFGETDPIRQALIGRSAGFLGIPSGGGGIQGTAAPDGISNIRPFGMPLGIQQTGGGAAPPSITRGGRPFHV